MSIDTYANFVRNPTKGDVIIFEVEVYDLDNVLHTFYWSGPRPSNSPEIAKYKPRVRSGGINYEGPSFDVHNPSWGVLQPPSPAPLVVSQFDADLDPYISYRWPGAVVTVKHGGYTSDGWLPLSEWETINVVEIGGVPDFNVGDATFPLRNKDARFDDVVEDRKLAALGWGIQGDGANVGVSFNPFSPGVGIRSRSEGRVGDSGNNVIVTRPVGGPDPQIGDELTIAIGSHSNDTAGTYDDWDLDTGSLPSGWTLEEEGVSSQGGVAAHRVFLFKKIVSGTEPASYTFPGTGTPCARCWEFVNWYGQHATTPLPVTNEDSPDAADATAESPTVTTPNAKDIVYRVWVTQNGDTGTLNPNDDLTPMANLKKKTGTSNSCCLRTARRIQPVAGAAGVAVLSLPSNSRHAAITAAIGNRVSGGDPDKLDLVNSFTMQFALVYGSTGATQHLKGWEATPFRVSFDSNDHLVLSWEKGAVPDQVVTSYTFVDGRRYHVEIVVQNAIITITVYDWLTADEDPQQFTAGGYNGRDSFTAGDEYTYLYNDNAGSPSQFSRCQLWSCRLWDYVVTNEDLKDRRMRPLNESEKYDPGLIHYVDFAENGSGLIIGDRALSPADGFLRTTVTGPTTINAVAAVPGTPQYFERLAGSFITDGWVVGRAFTPTNFTNSANAGRSIYIRALTATRLYVEGVKLANETGSGNETLTSYDWRPTLTGTVDQLGQEVPNVFGGPIRSVPGLQVEISPVNGTYFMIHPSAIEDFIEIQEGGFKRSISSDFFGNDLESWNAFQCILPDVGTTTTYRGDIGSFYKHRIKPTKPSTCTVLGDSLGGTFVYTAADIVRRVLTTRGEEPLADPADLDTSSITTLNTDNSSPIGTLVGNGETIRDFCRRVLGSIGAVVWQRRDGTFRFERFEGAYGAPTRSYDSYVTVIDSVRALPVELPVKEVVFKYEKNWLVQTRDQLDGNVTDPKLLAFLLSEWRKESRRRWQVAANFLRSRVMTVESYFSHPDSAFIHAGNEASRLLTLFGTVPQFFDISIRQGSSPTQFLDRIRLTISDIDHDNELRSRLGVDSSVFVVVGISDDREQGLEHLRVWRQDINA